MSCVKQDNLCSATDFLEDFVSSVFSAVNMFQVSGNVKKLKLRRNRRPGCFLINRITLHLAHLKREHERIPVF